MPHALVDDQRVWYQIDGTGEPIALIGGFALQHDQFEFCTPLLNELGYQAINWDCRGSGKSDWTLVRPYSVDDWVEDLRAILDVAGIERTNIWATSTGSVIGLRFAAKYPERMRALVTYPWYKADRYWQELFEVVEGVCRMFSPKALAKIFAGSVLPPSVQGTDEQIEYEKWSGVAYERNLNLTTLRVTLDALVNVDLTGDVPRISCPLMLLLGNESALNQMAHKKSASYDKLVSDFLALKPEAELGIVKGAGGPIVCSPDRRTRSRFCMAI